MRLASVVSVVETSQNSKCQNGWNILVEGVGKFTIHANFVSILRTGYLLLCSVADKP